VQLLVAKVLITPIIGHADDHSRSKTVPIEICQDCGKTMMEQSNADKAVCAPVMRSHSAIFYEEWLVCPNGHLKGYVVGYDAGGLSIGQTVSMTQITVVRA
jgi:hypothetical protein